MPTPSSSDGGAAPVSCVLSRDAVLSVRTVGSHPILWDALYDNIDDFTPLTTIPAGLGLSFLFNGTAAAITTTTAGVWALSYAVSLQADATWAGTFNSGAGQETVIASATFTPLFTLTPLVALPAGVILTPALSTATQATANPYNTNSLTVVLTRLG